MKADQLAENIQTWAKQLGFQQVGICEADPGKHKEHLKQWLNNQYHGEMRYMADRYAMRCEPDLLLPEAKTVISVRMDYLSEEVETVKLLDHPSKAYISRYALGRDYHKLMRKRLAQLATKIESAAVETMDKAVSQRPFVDSAPILERCYAEKSGLGWIGKNTMLINQKAGSWFFLGELISNIELPIDLPKRDTLCGSCTKCLDICPTNAFVEPYQLDARKCISYLTIENKEGIPQEYRDAIGNRVFGCDDCNIYCPWNKFNEPTRETDFRPRHSLDDSDLIDLFKWDENTFQRKTQGSPIYRIGYINWLRNLAVGLGNSKPLDPSNTLDALKAKKGLSPMLDEHIDWAIEKQKNVQTRKAKTTASN